VKLVTYVHEGESRLGALLGVAVVDLAGAYRAFREATPRDDLPEALPDQMLPFIAGGEPLLAAARSALDWLAESGRTWPFVLRLTDVKLGPPVPNPSKIICVGLNYADHCREQNVEPPERPMLFAKYPTSLIGINEPVRWPPEISQQVDFEGELALVIGKKARNVAEVDAYDYVAGYTIANDVSARDVQFGDVQWVRGKSFDTFCPMGPYLATPDEIPDPHNLKIVTRVNDFVMQDSNTYEMLFKIPEIIAFITHTSTLLPGDIINTGTPNGVGVFRTPQVFIKPGDVVTIEIERLGTLRNLMAGDRPVPADGGR
jgi:2-keto-4-pentenoate hydratase/2-oxohepta-3-ene-1,7-dioic acid hydratase in catechol pathway